MAIRTYRDAKGRTRYAVEFQQKGQRVLRRCPPGVGRTEAQALETKLRGEIFDQADLGKQPEISLDEAILRWVRDTQPHKKDQKKPAQNALLLAPFTEGKTLRQVPDAARTAITQWTAFAPTPSAAKPLVPAKQKALSPATINRRLCVLKAAAKYAYKQGWIDENLSARITLLPEDNKRRVYLQPPAIRTLAKAAPTRKGRAAIMIAAYTGMRAGELLALAKPPKGATTLPAQSKGGEPRDIPIVPLLRPYLSALPLELSYWQLHKEFAAARAKAKMPHVRFHDLRHSTASMLINAGEQLYTVGTILGHAGPQTTARYAHLRQRTLRKAMGRLR